MDRETKSIEIAGHTFIVKTYATALEANAIRQGYFKGAKVEVVGETPKISEFNPGIQFDVQQEMIRQLVVSMDGKTEGIVPACLELPTDAFDELTAQLDELISKKKEIDEAIAHYSMGRANPLMQQVAICQEFGWTYDEYMNQPNFFLTAIREKMIRDNKERELEAKKSKRGR